MTGKAQSPLCARLRPQAVKRGRSKGPSNRRKGRGGPSAEDIVFSESVQVKKGSGRRRIGRGSTNSSTVPSQGDCHSREKTEGGARIADRSKM